MDDSKSPISAVHETAFKYNMSATFEVIDEQGPPHLRTFVTECRVGDQFKTMGEGNGKKVSTFLSGNFPLQVSSNKVQPNKFSF